MSYSPGRMLWKNKGCMRMDAAQVMASRMHTSKGQGQSPARGRAKIPWHTQRRSCRYAVSGTPSQGRDTQCACGPFLSQCKNGSAAGKKITMQHVQIMC